MGYAIHEQDRSIGQLGVKRKSHTRNYKVRRGYPDEHYDPREIEQFTAACGNGSRHKLKVLHNHIYTMTCGNKTVLVDTLSGNQIQRVVAQIETENSTRIPKLFDLIDANEMPFWIIMPITGFEDRAFMVKEAAPFILKWRFFFTDVEMTEGYGMSIRPRSNHGGHDVEEKVLFCQFGACRHNWRSPTRIEKQDYNLKKSRDVRYQVCDICRKIKFAS